MSQNDGGNGDKGGTGKTSFGVKAGYIGTGVLIGLVIYPFVRKTLSTVQPKLDKIFDNLTGKAENLAEKASDLMAHAKENLFKAETEKDKSKATHEGHER